MKKQIIGTALASVLAFAGAGCSNAPDRDESGSITEEGELDAFSIAVGDCMLKPQMVDGEFTDIAAVPCSEPHDLEAISIFDITDEVTFPGVDATNEMAQTRCLEQFDAIIGTPFMESSLDLTVFTPSLESWAIGDREVICLANDLDGNSLTGTVKGSGL